jgi:hypothetical protein
VFEEHCVTDSCCPGFHNVDVETLVTLHRHPDIETSVHVNVPRLSVLGFDMGLLYIPVLALTHPQTDGLTDRETN